MNQQHRPMTVSRHRRLVARLALGAGLAVAVGTSVAPAAVADPGNPGVPSAPKTIFYEGFGTGAAPGQLALLANYGAANYTADAPWLSAAAGNGLVIDGTTTNETLTAAGYTGPGTNELRALATKLGDLNGSNPANLNHAVTAYSDADPGANRIEFRTKTPLNLNADGRFLTVSANVAAVNCVRGAVDPALVFYLDDNGTASRVNDTALSPCPTTGATDAAFAKTLQGGRAVLFEGNSVGVILRNEEGSGQGNDHAYDDIRVLDVTPQLDKKFADDGKTLKPGDVTDLELTITNTSELGVKTGWSFTDALPKGLKVAGDATTSCAAATIAADDGDDTIAVTDGSLADGATSCSIVVPVSAAKGGTYRNSAANITSTGLDAPGATTIKYADEEAVDGVDDLAAPDTGEQRASVWEPWALAGTGLALMLGLLGRSVVGRRRS